jgi:hypothetical protein
MELHLCVSIRLPTLREEHRLKALANRVVRRIFGPKKVELMGDEKITF